MANSFGVEYHEISLQEAGVNVVDRMLHGYVADFLDFHYAGWYFPAFNIADSTITIGASSPILDELLRVRKAK